jgi:hypothetical protein
MAKTTYKVSNLQLDEIDFPEPEKPPVPSFLEQSVIVRGFTLADLVQSGDIIIARLKKKYPRVSDKVLFSYLRDIVYSNEHHILRTDNAFAAARLKKDTFMPMWAEELFVFCDEGCVGEGVDLYKSMFEWAKSHSVSEFYIDEMSDVPRDLIRAHFGKISVYERSSVTL